MVQLVRYNEFKDGGSTLREFVLGILAKHLPVNSGEVLLIGGSKCLDNNLRIVSAIPLPNNQFHVVRETGESLLDWDADCIVETVLNILHNIGALDDIATIRTMLLFS